MSDELRAEIVREANERLRDVLCVDGVWVIDYVRIRMRARKVK